MMCRVQVLRLRQVEYNLNIGETWVLICTLMMNYFYNEKPEHVLRRFVQDALAGSATNEIRVKFLRKIDDNVPVGED